MQRILSIPPVWVYVTVTLLVFAEDAIFVGFVVPGETAALLGGVAASQGHVPVWAMVVLVIVGAIAGDSVGYEVGRHFGTRLLGMSILDGHRGRIDRAQDFLARRGGWAVFLGRFTAFFRAVMPALVGSAHMPYPRFLTFNAAGGVIWGGLCVMLGYLAGHSYIAMSRNMGRGMAISVGSVVVVALIAWRVREHRRTRQAEQRFRTSATSDDKSGDNLRS